MAEISEWLRLLQVWLTPKPLGAFKLLFLIQTVTAACPEGAGTLRSRLMVEAKRRAKGWESHGLVVFVFCQHWNESWVWVWFLLWLWLVDGNELNWGAEVELKPRCSCVVSVFGQRVWAVTRGQDANVPGAWSPSGLTSLYLCTVCPNTLSTFLQAERWEGHDTRRTAWEISNRI